MRGRTLIDWILVSTLAENLNVKKTRLRLTISRKVQASGERM